jgi:cytochrome c peroxidase
LSDDPEVTGVPADPAPSRQVIDPDSGRGGIDTRRGLIHAFKTPTVRAAAMGGPYMHNGVFPTLDALLAFYNRGGGAGAGITLPNQTLSPTPLHLTTTDRADLVAFLRALVDTAGLTSRATARVP